MGLGRGSGFSDGNITIGTQVDTYGISQGLNKIQKSFNKLKSMAGVLGGFGLVKLGKQAIEAASNLAEVQNIVDVSFGEMEYKIENFAKTCIDSFGMSEFSAKQTAGSFMAMGKAAGISMDEASDMAVRLTALSGDMASFYNIRQEYAKVALSAVYTGETETLKRYGIILTEANLQQYALTQGITTSVKAMSARDKAMLRYNYILQATADVTGDFVRTQDNWANQVRVLKEVWNQFLITVGSGLITILKPAIKILNVFIRYLTAWANKIGHILARLLGIDWEEMSSGAGELEDEFGGLGGATDDLADSSDDLADSIADSTKKAKKALAPFDELNVIEEDLADSSSKLKGLGIGIPMADGGLDFGDVLGGGFSGEAEIPMPDISSWYEFGKYLSDTLKDILDKINWNEIYEKASNFGTNLADYINGLMQPETFKSIGKTVAGGLNTAIKFALSLGQELDFSNIGKSFSEAINGFFTEWNATDAGKCIDTWFWGFWDVIKSFFANLDYPTIELKLDDFFSELTVTEMFDGLEDTVEGLVWTWYLTVTPEFILPDDMREELKKKADEKWQEGENQIWDWYFKVTPDFVLEWVGLDTEETQKEWKEKFAKQFPSAEDFLTFLPRYFWDPNFEVEFMGQKGAIGTAVDLFTLLGDAVSKGWDKVVETFSGTKTWITDNIFTPISDTFTKIAGVWDIVVEKWGEAKTRLDENIITPIKETFESISITIWEKTEWIRQVFESLWIIIKAIWILAKGWFSDNVIDPIVTAFDNLKTKVSTFFSNLWLGIQTIWGIVATWFETKIITPIVTKFNNLKTKVQTAFTTLWTAVSNIWSTVSSWFTSKVITPITTSFTTLKTKIQNVFSTVWNYIKGIWSNASTWFNTYVITPITNAFTNIWTGIVTGVKSGINSVITVVEGFVNSIIDGINKFTSGLSVVASVAASITGDDYEGITQIQHIQIPRLAKGAVIPPNKEFLAVLGDQKHGTNIEAPLDTLVAAFREASDNNGMLALMAQQIQLLQIIADKDLSIGDNAVFKSVQRSAAAYIKRTGAAPFSGA